MTTIKILTEQLEESKIECIRLRKENAELKQKLAHYCAKPLVDQATEKIVKPKSPISTSATLSSRLFHQQQ